MNIGSTFAQVSTFKHTVSKGETIYQISKKYDVSVDAIIELNPSAELGIIENQQLIIPKNSKSSPIYHKVQPKETLYGISKEYNISIEKLYELNPEIESGLKIGQVIRVQDTKNSTSTTDYPKNSLSSGKNEHIIQESETLYSIANQNNTTVSEILELNPNLSIHDLRIGTRIILPNATNVSTNKKQSLKPVNTKKDEFLSIEVQAKETLYSIEKKYNVSYGDLIYWNPELKNGLKEGMILKIKKNKEEFGIENILNDRKHNEVSININKDQTDIAVLIPFNLNKLNPKNPRVKAYLAKDVFSNIVLDFYSGIVLASEEFPNTDKITIEVIDSEESNRDLNINELLKKINDKEIIVGPFFQKNVDNLCKALENTNTIVFSPLSSEKKGNYANQIHTMPNDDTMKNQLINYLNTEGKNTVFVGNFSRSLTDKVDNSREIIGNFNDKENWKLSLDKNQKNYVVVDTNLHQYIDIVNTLIDLQKEYDINLVSMEKNQVVDAKKIATKKLAQLELIYPSVTNDESSKKRRLFVEKYYNKYQTYPSKYAIRGYDIMKDVLDRVLNKKYTNHLFEKKSEQIENRFDYLPENSGVLNQGVYILQYTKDNTIKKLQ